MTATQDIVKDVATKLGWDKGSYWLIDGAKACCPYDATEGFSLIVFVAYAKAEMANEPTDPESVVRAELRCLADALRPNQ